MKDFVEAVIESHKDKLCNRCYQVKQIAFTK